LSFSTLYYIVLPNKARISGTRPLSYGSRHTNHRKKPVATQQSPLTHVERLETSVCMPFTYAAIITHLSKSAPKLFNQTLHSWPTNRRRPNSLRFLGVPVIALIGRNTGNKYIYW